MTTRHLPALPLHFPKPGAYSSHLNFRFSQLHTAFSSWDVALTVAATFVLATTVVLIVRRLRPR